MVLLWFLRFFSSNLTLLLSCHSDHFRYSCVTTVFVVLVINRWVELEFQIFQPLLYAKHGTVCRGNKYKVYKIITSAVQCNSHSNTWKQLWCYFFLPQVFSLLWKPFLILLVVSHMISFASPITTILVIFFWI